MPAESATVRTTRQPPHRPRAGGFFGQFPDRGRLALGDFDDEMPGRLEQRAGLGEEPRKDSKSVPAAV